MAFVTTVNFPLLSPSATKICKTLSKPCRFVSSSPRRPRTIVFSRCTAKSQSHSACESNSEPSIISPLPSISNSSSNVASQQPSHSSLHRLRNRIYILLASGMILYALTRLPPPDQMLSLLSTHASALGHTRSAILLACINFFTVLFCFPANMAIMLAAGALLPATYAFLALLISKTAAASVAFVLSRSILHSRATSFLKSRPRLNKILLESGRDGGWKFILLMRLSPFPGFLLNYLLSFTGVSFTEYVFATVMGIMPSVLNLVLLGAAASDVTTGVVTGGVAFLPLILKLACIASTALAMVFVTRLTRKAFADVDIDSSELHVSTRAEDV